MLKIAKIILVPVIIIGLGLYFTGLIFAPAVPVSEAENMESSISFARKIDAPKYAPEIFSECLSLHDSLIKEWKTQNKLWIIRRDYSLTKELIKRTTEKAIEAGKKSIEKESTMKQFISDSQADLQERDNYFREKFRVLPLEKETLKKYSQTHLLLKESLEASVRGEINSAYLNLIMVEENFSELEQQVHLKLEDYFESYPSWDKWYKQTIEKSRTNKSYAIIVDKMAHECILVKNGKIIDRYEAELSVNWIGHKKQQGDFATPEGIYMITRKINSRDTKYHKALLLNYPNENDLVHFNDEKRSGSLSESAKIGGLIEIHGDGGKGKDWTEGCVALTNSDIDKLYSIVNSGTVVTIVGSLIPMEELFN